MSLSASSPTTAKANPLRFSLRTLLELLTFAAIVSCALFSRELYRDESVFLLGFPAGLWVGRSIGRWRGRSGVLEAALGGGVGCAIASGLASECLPRQLDLAEYLAVSIPAGLLLGGALAGCYWLLVDAPPTWRAWRRALLSIVVILGVAAIAAWGYRRATDWSPRLEVVNKRLYDQVQSMQSHPDSCKICAFSPQGNYLAWQWENNWYGTNKKEIELFKIERRRLTPVKLDALTPDASSIVFAPDEKSLAFLKERSPRMHVIDLQGRETQSAEVRSPDYHFLDNELAFSRDGQEIFACWHTEHVRQWTAFARDSLQEQRSHSFAFDGRLFVSPSGKWLVKLHQKRTTTDYLDFKVPACAEIVATADLKVVREYEIRADLRVPPGLMDGVPGAADQEYRFLAQVINEMFPDSKIRIAVEGALQGQGVLTVRGYARDAEESQQIVTLIWSQVNGPKKRMLNSGDVEHIPQLRVMNMLDHLSIAVCPVFDPDENYIAFGRRVMQLTAADQTADQGAVTELPGKVVGLLSRGRALLLVGSEPSFRTRMPFLRHWFPVGAQSNLCVVEIATGKTLRRSARMRWGGFDFHLAQDGRTAVGFDYRGTLQIWDIPQVE